MNDNRSLPRKTYLFFRNDPETGKIFFYPVEEVSDEKILGHIKLNPGTLRVESVTGRIVWRVGDPL